LSWLIGSPSPGSLYPALRSLLDDGLVTVDVAVREDRPPRKEYHVTDEGKRVVKEWVNQPVMPDTLKAFAMRLILASNLSPAALQAHLEQRRLQVARHHDALVEGVSILKEANASGQRLALDYALAVARSELGWLDGTLGRLREDAGAEAAAAEGIGQATYPPSST
jgi:DNA-binding PadR family transcriptional regulator